MGFCEGNFTAKQSGYDYQPGFWSARQVSGGEGLSMSIFRSIFQFFQRHLLLTVLIVAFLGRLAAVLVLGSPELEHEYAPIVLNLAAGRGFVYYAVDRAGALTTQFLAEPKLLIPSAFKSPVYPFFLFFWVKLFGAGLLGMRVIEILQAGLGVFSAWLVYWIAREKLGQPQAILAAVGMAFYPLLVYSVTQISDTIIFLTLEILTLWLFIRLEKAESTGLFLTFSFSLALFMLARPEGFFYLPFFLFWLWRRFPGRWLPRLAGFAVICALVLAPWAVRNYFQLGRLALNTSGGLNLWEGQNRNAVGVPSWYLDPPISLRPEAAAEIFGRGFDRQFEIKQDSVYMREALADLRADPGRALSLAGRKFIFFWTSRFFGFNFTYDGAKSPIYWLPWLAMLPFFLLGLALSLKEARKFGVFYLVFLVSTFTCLLFFVLPRYTVLVYPWAILFAAQGVWQVYLIGANWAMKVSNGSSARGV
jgi:4-amino-4-deoxy-L-arabinose transferase-like glycosyltransferase